MNPLKVIGALLLHMFSLQKHVQSIFVRVEKGSAARLAPLDGIRAMAFLMVAFTHWRDQSSPLGSERFYIVTEMQTGQHGVLIFFVLSGFLIPMVLVKATEKGKSSSVLQQVPGFLHGRFLRVWPSINMFVPLSLGFLYGPNLASKLEPCSTYWTYEGELLWAPFLCINNYIPGRSSDPFGHLYTVSTEIQMYFCTPLMVATYYKSHHPYTGYVVVLFVALGCLLASYVLGTQFGGATPGCLWDCLPSYCMGMLASYSYMDSTQQNSGRWRMLDPLRLWEWRAAAVVMVSLMQASMLVVLLSNLKATHSGTTLLLSVCAAILMRSALDPDLGGLGCYFFSSWPFYPIASLSYTGYLWSSAAPDISRYLLKDSVTWDTEVLILIGDFLKSMLVLMGLAFFISVFIERPFMSIREFSLKRS